MSETDNSLKNSSEQHSCANIITLSTQQDAQNQAFADATTSGARVFQCHIYEQGQRKHLTFSLPFNLLLEMAKLNSAQPKANKNNAEEYMNRPIITQHVNDIARYLLETENYILPPLIFNTNTPIKVFAFGSGAIQLGYAIIPSSLKLYVTDGQHRIQAIEKAIKEKPKLQDDSITVLVVQEEDIDQIHQDFADCAKNKPIPPALLTVFDVSNVLAKLTRKISRDLVIFDGRIDKLSKTINKEPHYLFTMSQLKIGLAEFLFGSSRKQVIESRLKNNQQFASLFEKAQLFYMEFASNNDTWKILLKPSSSTVNLDLYELRKDRIDFNTVGFQIINRVGHRIFFTKDFSEEQRYHLIRTLASLDYSRNSGIWDNSVVIDDDKGGKKIIAQMPAVDKGFKAALREVEQRSGLVLT